MLYGRLQTIAWRASTPAGGPPTSPAADVVHQVRVEMTSTALRQLPQGVRLLPGMSVTADIEVGTRSIIGYVLYPITRGFDEVAREP
jgi:HlyD family secretion protein